MGACGVGPFKARSPDARRRSHPAMCPSPPPLSSLLLCCLRPPRVSSPLPRYLLEEAKSNLVATASMKSHPSRVSRFLLFHLFLSHTFSLSLFLTLSFDIPFPFVLVSLFSLSLRTRRKQNLLSVDIHSAVERIYVLIKNAACV